MTRKVYYSKPLKYFWRHLYGTQKKLTPGFTDEQIFYLLKKSLLETPLGADETQELRGLTISGLELWREDSREELLHFSFWISNCETFLRTLLCRIWMALRKSYTKMDKAVMFSIIIQT